MEEKVLEVLNKIEEERRKNRRIEKVSFEVFRGAVEKLNPGRFSESKIKELYEDLPSPRRGTNSSAGYDFYAPYDFELKENERLVVPTGYKVSMNSDEIFSMYVRSSTGFKFNVRLCNQVGIIDADYYNNKDNEGHIMVAFHNHGDKVWENFTEGKDVSEKSRIAQGIYTRYYVSDNDNASRQERTGGIGSTSK